MLAAQCGRGPGGRQVKILDLEKLAGDVVFTCPPYVLEPLFEIGDDLTFEDIETVQVPPGSWINSCKSLRHSGL